MALSESMWEEFGLAPRWVMRGTQAGSTNDAAAHAAVPVEIVAPDGVAEDRFARTGSVEARRTVPPAERDNVRHADEPTIARDAAPADATSAPASDDDFAWFDDAPETARTRHDASAPRIDDRPVPVDDPSQPAIHTLDWTALEARVSGCEKCRLCETRKQTVFGVGDRQADWMVIGEAPGEFEDIEGEPFVGKAGKLLDSMLRALSLERGTNVYIANVLKCRPPGNRNPEPDEVARCEPYLQRQLELIQPKLIVALGRFAAQSLLKTEASISSLRGRVHSYENVPVIVTYHPSYLLRTPNDKAKSWVDLCLARDVWRKAKGVDAPTQAS